MKSEDENERYAAMIEKYEPAPPVERLPLRHKRQTFLSEGGVLDLGSGTRVTFRSLQGELLDERGTYRIRATVDLQCTVTLGRAGEYHTCSGCEAIPPEPDLDAMFFILEHHSGQRIVFADEEQTSDRADTYPVTWWRKIDHKLYCGECATEIEASIKALRKKRPR